MSGIQLTEKIGGAAGKDRGIKANEVSLDREFFPGLPQRRFEELGESEEMASLWICSPSETHPPIHTHP